MVDRLTKTIHFLALSHPYTISTVAKKYMTYIIKLHRLPDSIISDRDRVFISHFWQDLFHHAGRKVQLPTAYHLKSNGKTEVLNRCLEGYLRCMTREHPNEWVNWLPMVKWCYNSTHHSTIDTTPYEALYGQTSSSPHFLLSWLFLGV